MRMARRAEESDVRMMCSREPNRVFGGGYVYLSPGLEDSSAMSDKIPSKGSVGLAQRTGCPRGDLAGNSTSRRMRWCSGCNYGKGDLFDRKALVGVDGCKW